MSVAFIGLGAMGSRIAGRLLDAGYDVVVWNRTARREMDAAAVGARTDAACAAGDLRLVTAARSRPAEAEAAGLGGLDYSAVLARISGD